jgi:hypothetical protein
MLGGPRVRCSAFIFAREAVVTLRLRILLDTNILIPLQDSMVALQPSLTNFVRLVGVGGHQMLVHPASLADITRDSNLERRGRTLARLDQYTRLEVGSACPWNSHTTSANDACDNEILFSVENDAVHALVTEDHGLHTKARAHGLQDRVYFIQSAEDWLKRLHEPGQTHLPNIRDVPLHALTSMLAHPFFDSLRDGYSGFDNWFRAKARDGRRAWVYGEIESAAPSAICIYAIQENESINDAHEVLPGKALKLCTFKVADQVRGRKIGELFLKAAFRHASLNRCENVFIHADEARHVHLILLLEDFGFAARGTYGSDTVFVKQHPVAAPPVDIDPSRYVRQYFPHFRMDVEIGKFIVPIQPRYHQILFPDFSSASSTQLGFPLAHVGNAMKLAYLCHSPTRQIREGDIVLFYRTHDLKQLTTIGVVDRFETSTNASEIAALVSRRTVYSREEIEAMAQTPTKVILFRLIGHFAEPISYSDLLQNRIVRGPIQSILRINDESFSRILSITNW